MVERHESGGSISSLGLVSRLWGLAWGRVGVGEGVRGGRCQGGSVSAQETQRFFRRRLPGSQACVLCFSRVLWFVSILPLYSLRRALGGEPRLKGSRAQSGHVTEPQDCAPEASDPNPNVSSGSSRAGDASKPFARWTGPRVEGLGRWLVPSLDQKVPSWGSDQPRKRPADMLPKGLN